MMIVADCDLTYSICQCIASYMKTCFLEGILLELLYQKWVLIGWHLLNTVPLSHGLTREFYDLWCMWTVMAVILLQTVICTFIQVCSESFEYVSGIICLSSEYIHCLGSWLLEMWYSTHHTSLSPMSRHCAETEICASLKYVSCMGMAIYSSINHSTRLLVPYLSLIKYHHLINKH